MILNATLLRIDHATGTGSFVLGDPVEVRCALAKTPQTLFQNVSANQSAFPNVGRLYVPIGGLEDAGFDVQPFQTGDRIDVRPDGRVSREYVINYCWDHNLPDSDLSHYEIDLRDESASTPPLPGS